jgi:BlaI family transcriptional regulator, penicillinase repressor
MFYERTSRSDGVDEIVFTGRELDVMSVLWMQGPSTVAEVKDHLDVPLAYTTVLTVLRTLEAKGHVTHESDGKAHRYAAAVARDAAGRSALGRIVEKIFGGSRELLLTQLVDARSVDAEELKRLRRVLNERLREEGGTKS